jgi:hypothetical protein
MAYCSATKSPVSSNPTRFANESCFLRILLPNLRNSLRLRLHLSEFEEKAVSGSSSGRKPLLRNLASMVVCGARPSVALSVTHRLLRSGPRMMVLS